MKRPLVTLGLLLLGGCAGTAASARGTGSAETPTGMSLVAAFTAPRLAGGSLTFDPAARERPTLLVFWATWCASCRAELPHLLELAETKREKLEIIGVSVDEEPQKAAAFAVDHQLPYENLADATLAIADRFQITATPGFVLIAPGGRVLHVATALDDGLRSAIERAIK